VEAARAEGVTISRSAEAGIAEALGTARARTWAEENREVLDVRRAWIDEHGTPLARWQAGQPN
jgi:antitoxin CcdA